MVGEVLAQANHHVAERFAHFNKDLRDVEEGLNESFHNDSARRADALGTTLKETPPTPALDDLVSGLNLPPVLNGYTCQQMVFCPRTGAVKVWRRVDE
jgi:hypothetical protein